MQRSTNFYQIANTELDEACDCLELCVRLNADATLQLPDFASLNDKQREELFFSEDYFELVKYFGEFSHN